MKKYLFVALVICLLFTCAFAQDSPTKETIIHTGVIDVVPEKEDEEVIPPIVDIIPDTPSTIDVKEEIKMLYHLVIYYVDIDNNKMFEPYEDILNVGEEYKVPSPILDKYLVSQIMVKGTMPKCDLQYVVIYTPISNSEFKTVIPIEYYTTPLGLGFTILNVGICFE